MKLRLSYYCSCNRFDIKGEIGAGLPVWKLLQQLKEEQRTSYQWILNAWLLRAAAVGAVADAKSIK